MLAEPIFQFTEELSQQASKSSQSCSAASATNTQQTSAGVMAAAVASATGNDSNSERIIPPLRASLKRPSKLELKINLNEQQTESMSPMNSTPMSMVHLQQTPQQHQSSLAQSNTNHATSNPHSHDKNNNFLKQK